MVSAGAAIRTETLGVKRTGRSVIRLILAVILASGMQTAIIRSVSAVSASSAVQARPMAAKPIASCAVTWVVPRSVLTGQLMAYAWTATRDVTLEQTLASAGRVHAGSKQPVRVNNRSVLSSINCSAAANAEAMRIVMGRVTNPFVT